MFGLQIPQINMKQLQTAAHTFACDAIKIIPISDFLVVLQGFDISWNIDSSLYNSEDEEGTHILAVPNHTAHPIYFLPWISSNLPEEEYQILNFAFNIIGSVMLLLKE